MDHGFFVRLLDGVNPGTAYSISRTSGDGVGVSRVQGHAHEDQSKPTLNSPYIFEFNQGVVLLTQAQ